MRRRHVCALLVGLALAAAPNAYAASFKGSFALAFTAGQVRGYTVQLSGTVGTSGGLHDELSLDLSKQSDGVFESHSWSFALAPGEAKVNRSRVLVKVRHSLGAAGKVDFTFIGRPHLQRELCPGPARFIVVADGTVRASIRVRLGDRFFKTIVVRRMSGSALNLYLCPGSFCPSPGYAVSAQAPYDPSAASVSFDAGGRSGRNPAWFNVSVQDPTAGTPFVSIFHEMSTFRVTNGARRSVRHATRISVTSDPQLAGATVRASGRLLSGELGFAAAGSPNQAVQQCGRHRQVHSELEAATVTTGSLVAHFDSIGNVVLDAGLNGTVYNPGVAEIERTF